MKPKENKRSIGQIVCRGIQLATIFAFCYERFYRITEGRPPMPLMLYFFLLTAPASVYRFIAERNARKADPEALRAYDKTLLHGFLLGIGLLLLVFVGIVCYAATRAIYQ